MTHWNKNTIATKRKELKMTQVELAENVGSTQQRVSEWELGICEPSPAYQKLLTLLFEGANGFDFHSSNPNLPDETI